MDQHDQALQAGPAVRDTAPGDNQFQWRHILMADQLYQTLLFENLNSFPFQAEFWAKIPEVPMAAYLLCYYRAVRSGKNITPAGHTLAAGEIVAPLVSTTYVLPETESRTLFVKVMKWVIENGDQRMSTHHTITEASRADFTATIDSWVAARGVSREVAAAFSAPFAPPRVINTIADLAAPQGREDDLAYYISVLFYLLQSRSRSLACDMLYLYINTLCAFVKMGKFRSNSVIK